MTPEPPTPDDPRYERAARLLAQKLGTDWRTLPAEQVIEYWRKIEVARQRQTTPKSERRD